MAHGGKLNTKTGKAAKLKQNKDMKHSNRIQNEVCINKN